jgi:hypothetical protein
MNQYSRPRLAALLRYYYQGEPIDEQAAATSSPTALVYPSPAATSTVVVDHHYFHHSAPVVFIDGVRQSAPTTTTTTSAASAPAKEVRRPSESTESTSKATTEPRRCGPGLLALGALAILQYPNLCAWKRARRTSRDQDQVFAWMSPRHDDTQLCAEAFRCLSQFRANRYWSLLNQGLLTSGVALGAAGFFLPCGALLAPAALLLGCGVLSGAARCAVCAVFRESRQRLGEIYSTLANAAAEEQYRKGASAPSEDDGAPSPPPPRPPAYEPEA